MHEAHTHVLQKAPSPFQRFAFKLAPTVENVLRKQEEAEHRAREPPSAVALLMP